MTLRLSESQALLLRELEIPLWNARPAAMLPAAACLLGSREAAILRHVAARPAGDEQSSRVGDAGAPGPRSGTPGESAPRAPDTMGTRDAARAQLSELRASLAKPALKVNAAGRSAALQREVSHSPVTPTAASTDVPIAPAATSPVSAPAVPPTAAEAAVLWERLQDEVKSCRRCAALCDSRRQTVFGVGDEHRPDWMFVGEAPGAEEDRRGVPFVGPAGQLLDRMLAALQLNRSERVYIANVLKCRPPGNRDPAPDEIAACADFLDRQIDALRPRILVALGRPAAGRLTGQVEAKLGDLRGKVHAYRGIPLVVTYHPAYLLRAPEQKARAWVDLQLAARTLRGAVE